MKRRNFIRIVGGGIVTAASAGVTGCSSRMPAVAIEAWKGPAPQADVRRWILSYAILAPHSDTFVLDAVDAVLEPAISDLGLRTHVTDTIMADAAGRSRLAAELLAVASASVPT